MDATHEGSSDVTTVARLISVNVGLPRDIAWNGRTVHTAIWKDPVPGRCRARRLNLDGDGQGDLAGHGGEQRAVFVYQLDAYRYWQDRLQRTDFVHGQFGENFTVDGLPDAEVCIGDRYRIGSALFEVSQPRVTCYRVGIRMNEPRMPALLTSSGRPGFYFRVLQEGDVGAGDEIVKVSQASERMTVEAINALLYSPNHARDQLERALTIEALSPGWRSSFMALLQSHGSGNAGLVPDAAAHPSPPGFRTLKVANVTQESVDVESFDLQDADGQPLPLAVPGQYIVLRIREAGATPFFRSYSLCGEVSPQHYRISVKIEPKGAGGTYLRDHVRAGDALEVSAPRGSFLLQSGEDAVVLLSAGIGATPVLAMLYALANAQSPRPVFWLHAARDGEHHPFANEVRRLMQMLPHGRSHVCYSRPAAGDRLGKDFDAAGHFSQSMLEQIGFPINANVYLCGPARFMSDMKQMLAAMHVEPSHTHIEIFDGGESMTPGIADQARKPPHVPEHDGDSGVQIAFARSGISAHWNPSAYQSLLELAEACDVPVRWSCRTGVCHNCESGLISGSVAYDPQPLTAPTVGNLLVCCSRPVGDVVIDL